MAGKGQPRTGGRVAGTPNRFTRTVREVFEQTFNALQDDPVNNLTQFAKLNPTEFYKLAAKLIPTDVALQGALTLQVVTGVPGDNDVSDLV
jgi:hypothetical protein